MRVFPLAIFAALALPACATRGTLDSDCIGFNARRLPPSQLVTDIQSGATRIDPLATGQPSISAEGAEDPLRRSLQSLVERRAPGLSAQDERPAAALLLLSGGGQWGAFGAGFVASLAEQGRLPDFGTITGVSTGGLQALFLGALGDPDLAGREQEVLREMMRRYRPASEAEVVSRDGRKEYSIVTGSFAGLEPLRRRIHAALCDRISAPTDCPVIRRLARSRTDVFVGFVGARDGDFSHSYINELARRAYPPGSTAPASREALAEAQRCIAGAALASAAMPVFFQQVRVGPRQAPVTYYDGGVRQSVFEAHVAGLLESAVAAARARSGLRPGAEPAIYVIRNGPTTLNPDDERDGTSSVIDGAMRAEAIVVNQLEVQSIADLRLAHPTGPISLITADGFGRQHPQPGDDPALPDLPNFAGPEEQEVCRKIPEDAMFSPAFMACIMRYGRSLARRERAWIELSELPLRQRAAEPGQ